MRAFYEMPLVKRFFLRSAPINIYTYVAFAVRKQECEPRQENTPPMCMNDLNCVFEMRSTAINEMLLAVSAM
jgi:hypothetical protein